jgi:hypothetical protein
MFNITYKLQVIKTQNTMFLIFVKFISWMLLIKKSYPEGSPVTIFISLQDQVSSIPMGSGDCTLHSVLVIWYSCPLSSRSENFSWCGSEFSMWDSGFPWKMSVWVAGVTAILTRHLPSTTLEHYCYTSLLSTADKNEVSFHHNRGKYTMIKDNISLNLVSLQGKHSVAIP